jgi:hypothetical protein
MKRNAKEAQQVIKRGGGARSRTISVRMGEPLLSIFCGLAATHAPVSDGGPELSAFLRRIVLDWIEWHAGEHELRQPPPRNGGLQRCRLEATASVLEMIAVMRGAGEVGPELAVTIARLCDLLADEYVGRR